MATDRLNEMNVVPIEIRMERLPIDTTQLTGLILISVDHNNEDLEAPNSNTGACAEASEAEALGLDEALAIVALEIRDRLTPTDHMQRISSDTIAIVRAPLSAPSETEALTQRLVHVARVALKTRLFGESFSISAGVAVSNSDDTAIELEGYAQHALNDARVFGGGQVAVFDDVDREELV